MTDAKEPIDPVTAVHRMTISGMPSGVFASEWECRDCGAIFIFGPDKPDYCGHCGEPFEEWDGLA